MEALSLSELFTLIAAGASVAIAAVAIGLSVVYFLLANRLFRKTEDRVEEIEKSVNEMYGTVTKLYNRSESSAAEFEGQVLQLQVVAEHFGKDAELFKEVASQTREQDQLQPHVNPQPSLESTLPRDPAGNPVLFRFGPKIRIWRMPVLGRIWTFRPDF